MSRSLSASGRNGDRPETPRHTLWSQSLIRSKIVCVLGMHRSGTSVAARILNLLGAYLGPEDQLVAPAADNPKGYWEFQPIVELNDAILRCLGGRSMAPPAMPVGWETAPQLDDLAMRARKIVEEAFSGAELWAWKDPRLCLTLPFWQHILPPMHYVICVRSPADVAHSLARRNRISHDRSVYLWLLYTHQALSHTGHERRRLTVYDRLMDQPNHELAALGHFLDVPDRSEQQEVRDDVAAFLDTELRHHRSGASGEPLDAARPGEVSAALKFAERAYLALTEREEFDPAEVDGLLRAGMQAVRPGIVRRPTPPTDTSHA